jgi:hypothetical protein
MIKTDFIRKHMNIKTFTKLILQWKSDKKNYVCTTHSRILTENEKT